MAGRLMTDEWQMIWKEAVRIALYYRLEGRGSIRGKDKILSFPHRSDRFYAPSSLVPEVQP
jgi:hypothetical protein